MARKQIDIEAQYGIGHAQGNRTVAQDYTLAQAQAKFPYLFNWAVNVKQFATDWPMSLTQWTAAAIDGVWEGNGSGFSPNVVCNSRNQILFPNGLGYINYHIPVSYGGVKGRGTNIATANGNNTSHLKVDHARWMPNALANRSLLQSVNWGTNNYLESTEIDNLRIDGSGPGWKDPSYVGHGMQLRSFGETARIGTVYVHDCNDDGVHLYGAGPGTIYDLSSFDNNLAGLNINNTNSLGNLKVVGLSCDNNGFAFYSDLGGAFEIMDIKCETGLSNSRGKPYKAQVPVWVKGWVSGHIGTITLVATPGVDGVVHFWNTANRSRLMIENIVNLGNQANLVVDHRNQVAYYTSPEAYNNASFSLEIKAFGAGNTTVTTSDIATYPLSTRTFNGQARLGPVSDFANYDFTAGTPVWDPTNGNIVTPPVSTATTIAVSISTTSVVAGDTATATGTILDQNGVPMSLTGTWSVSGPATINQSGVITTNGPGTVVATYSYGSVTPGTSQLTVTAVVVPPPTTGNIDPAEVVIVVNSAQADSQAMATAYANAWGIPSGNIVISNLGSLDSLSSSSTLSACRSAIAAKNKQYTVLAFSYPSRYGSQSITSAITFGPRNVTSLTTSPLYNYTGTTPFTTHAVRPSVLLYNQAYIRRTAHGTRPMGGKYMILAKDQSGFPRGSARAGQTATGLTIFDNRNNSTIGNGENAFNNLSTSIFTKYNTTPQPVVAYFGSMYRLCCETGITFRPGYYGDHVTSFGGYLPRVSSGSDYANAQGQTCLLWHMDKGAAASVGSVSEPWQGTNGSLPQQFLNVSIFLPLWLGGKSVIQATWAALQCPDRMLIVGDPLCAPHF